MITCKRRISVSWRFLAALAIPLLLLPMCFVEEDDIIEGDGSRPATKSKTAYVILVMALYWGLEVIPLPVTALLPLVMFPLLGVVTSYRVSENYTKESNMIFLGGVIVALGVEYCHLHRRVAIRIMMFVGTSPVKLLFGVMASTAFLSMWISATTCVALLVPLAVAIIDEIYESPELNNEKEPVVPAIDVTLSGPPSSRGRLDRRHSSSSTSGARHNKAPRLSSMFENSALEGIHHRRGSDALLHGHLHGHLRNRSPTASIYGSRSSINSPRSSLYPSLSTHQSDQHLNVANYDERPKPRQFAIVMQEIAAEPHNMSPQNPRKTVAFIEPERRSATSSYADLDEMEEEDEYVPTPEELKEEKRRADIKKMYLFAMAYSANIGGTAVITGTAPNKVFKEVIKLVDVTQNGKYKNITFFMWMALNLPPVIVNLLITWIYLIFRYNGIPNWRTWYGISWCFKSSEVIRLENEKMSKWHSRVKSYLEKEYESLGPLTFHEIAVGIIFVGVVFLWIFRDPELFGGWSSVIKTSKSGDSTAAMLGVLLLFICPKDFTFLFGSDKDAKYEALLDWKFVSSKMPWGVLLLLGSGFAISDASDYSGLSQWLGDELTLLEDLSRPGLLIVVIVMTSLATEVTSNVACANILLPIMLSVSTSMQIHPLYLTIPVAVTCSYAFLLPVAAPSNAIVFAAGNFSTLEMVKNGLFLNIFCVVVLYVNTLTLGNFMFDFENYSYEDTDS